MRVLTSTLVILAAAAVAAPRAEAARFYLGGHGGYDFLLGEEDFDDAATFGGALGVNFDGPALELSVFHLSTSPSDRTFATTCSSPTTSTPSTRSRTPTSATRRTS